LEVNSCSVSGIDKAISKYSESSIGVIYVELSRSNSSKTNLLFSSLNTPNFTSEKIEGFIGKSFIGNTDTGVFGGVYHFKSKEAVDTYLNSEFWEGIENHPNLVNFTKEIYGIAPISTISNGIPML
jgi:hypothetical protein